MHGLYIPYHHVTAIGSTEGNGALDVHVRQVLFDVLEAVADVFVGEAAPGVRDGVCELLTIAR